IGGEPPVLRAVRSEADDRRLLDPVAAAISRVGHGPGARTAHGVDSRPERSPARGRQEEQRAKSHGKIRIAVAPELVETCRTGGSTIRSNSRRCTASSGNPLPPRITLCALVFGSQNTRPLFGPA